MEFHDYANLFPLMYGEEFTALVEDIKENGLLNPIILLDGKILDGRNRFRACVEAGVEPKFQDYEGDYPFSSVLSLNVMRRNLEPEQKAIVAAKAWRIKELQEEGKRRMAEGGRKGLFRGNKPSNNPNSQVEIEGVVVFNQDKIENNLERFNAREYIRSLFAVRTENLVLADKILKTCAVLAEVSPEIGRYWEKVRDNELSLADAKQQLHAFSVHYEVDTEFVKAGAAKIEREQKAEEAKKARALEKELERQRLAQDTERKQQAAAERAEKEAQELQERTQKALQQTENEKEWARVAAEAIEAEKAVQEALKEEQQIIAVEQEQKQKAMELRQSAMDEALKAEAKIRRAQDSAFNKASLHLQTADSYLIPAIKLITETKLTATQLDSLGVLYDNLYKNLDLLNGVLGEETETTF